MQSNWGAYIEHCFLAVTPCCPGNIPLDAVREQIEAIGPAHCILSSDFGQEPNGPPVDGFAQHLEQLGTLGLPESSLRAMITENPEHLMTRNA